MKKTISESVARDRFGAFLGLTQQSPVGVLRGSELLAVLIRPQDYAAMRFFHANRLAQSFRDSALAAKHVAAAPEVVEQLLADVS